MLKRVLLSCVLLFTSNQVLAEDHETSVTEDHEAVRALASTYIKATKEADIETMRRIFHPDAQMNGYFNGQLMLGSPKPFFDSLVENPSMASTGTNFQADIQDVRVTGDVASFTLKETGFYGTITFTDYFHAIKIDGEWVITGKTFTTE